jgi:hypothetical protein
MWRAVLAQFRVDIESFVAREVIEAAVVPRRFELPPVSDVSYVAFCDPSGGSSDSFTLAIAHRDKDGHGIHDLVREVKPPFPPEQTVEVFAALLKEYGILRIGGDKYAGEWPREQFRKHGITYEASEKPKSDLYRELLPILNSGRVELLDHPRLIAQLTGLERRTARGDATQSITPLARTIISPMRFQASWRERRVNPVWKLGFGSLRPCSNN